MSKSLVHENRKMIPRSIWSFWWRHYAQPQQKSQESKMTSKNKSRTNTVGHILNLRCFSNVGGGFPHPVGVFYTYVRVCLYICSFMFSNIFVYFLIFSYICVYFLISAGRTNTRSITGRVQQRWQSGIAIDSLPGRV